MKCLTEVRRHGTRGRCFFNAREDHLTCGHHAHKGRADLVPPYNIEDPMTDEQAEEGARKVVERAKAESMNIAQARLCAAEHGLEITPVLMSEDGDGRGEFFRAFLYVTPDGGRRRLSTRILNVPPGGL